MWTIARFNVGFHSTLEAIANSPSEARLVHPISRKDVDVGEEGELWVRGPQTMM